MSGAAVRGLVPGVERLAVLRANAIGDLVVSLPALAALRTAYPGAQLTLIGDEWHRDLLAQRPGPWDRVVVGPRYPGLRGEPFDAEPGPDYEAFLVQQIAESYDLVVQLHGGGRTSNQVVQALKPRLSVGARTPEAPELDRWVPYPPDRHETLRCLEIVDLVGASITSIQDLAPRLAVTGQDLDESFSASASEVDVVVHLGANDSRRRWPVSSFAVLIERLTELGREVVLIGGAADRELVAELPAGVLPGCRDLVGRLTLGGTLGLLSRARLFVGNDSGPRHLAAAVGVPTVGIFWGPNRQTFGPLVGPHRAVTAYRTDCPRCGVERMACAHPDSVVAGVTVEEVLTAVADLHTG
ncbi:glycosyl transferase family 9 [Kribbella flavida DSM 17836]|uniref:Glycosyl transferase family 9 n=1 Tax=Kribbella flavida (strain DSM 17836 / JCM 10339 / NBRC 14399) TaxID=479435 RepID=D2PXE2_KRIFD|nr:glycosyltransferase family 9 protein [Kribbella flavida]ADB29790.1 glycosyl transferase family 9 [Kribbella flavida DSM 17836]